MKRAVIVTATAAISVALIMTFGQQVEVALHPAVTMHAVGEASTSSHEEPIVVEMDAAGNMRMCPRIFTFKYRNCGDPKLTFNWYFDHQIEFAKWERKNEPGVQGKGRSTIDYGPHLSVPFCFLVPPEVNDHPHSQLLGIRQDFCSILWTLPTEVPIRLTRRPGQAPLAEAIDPETAREERETPLP